MKKKYLVAAILVLITVLGLLLRFYRFYPNVIFNGEMGTDYIRVWQMLHGDRTWMIGPSTSHEWFLIPPTAYWIYAVVLSIANWSPLSVNIFWGIIGVLSIPICFYYVRKLFNSKVAIITSFLLSVSPAWIVQARDARYNILVSILFLPYLYYLKKSIEDKGKSLFKLGLVLGIMMSFFPSPLLLIPAVVVSFLFFKVGPRVKHIVNFVLGFVLPNITFLIYEIGNKFEITIKLVAWVPYRVLVFLGLYPKNTVDSLVVSQNTSSIYNFVSSLFSLKIGMMSGLLFILILVGLIFFTWKNYKSRKKEITYFLLLINLLVCTLGLFIHGAPPSHYYYTIFIVPLILTAYFLDKAVVNKKLLLTIILSIGGICITSLVPDKWFYQDTIPRSYQTHTVSYSIQSKITDLIINDSKGTPFFIKRIGPNDQFENNFANNYIYLLLVQGVKLDNNSNTRYTIIEGEENYQNLNGVLLFSEDNVYVFKNDI